MRFRYLTIEEAVEIHRKTVEVSGGGSTDAVDLGKLESVLEHIKNDDYYPHFEDKVTHLFFGTNKFHSFIDGNKRLSIVLTGQFLNVNGYMYCLGKFYTEMENISVHVADGKVNKALLYDLIYGILAEDFDNERLMLAYYKAIYE